jgi:CRISPR-associated protein Csm2
MADYRNNSFGNNRNSQNSSRPSYGQEKKDPVQEVKDWKSNNLCYDSAWIKNDADERLVEYAEKAGEHLAKTGLTTSKIRSIYGEIKRIQVSDFDKNKPSFYLLKPKVAYAVGRDNKNKGLILFQLIFNECAKDVTDKKSYQNFCNFIEAILAYHKANSNEK